MEKTLVIIKPSGVQRSLVGEVTKRFEQKGLQLVGIKMMQLSDEILSEHYAHLAEKPFFQRVKNGMMTSPVVVCCWKGVEAVSVVRQMTGVTNGRNAVSGTIRGDFSMSFQENIVHASDSPENAKIELERFFTESEIFEYDQPTLQYVYTTDEL